MLSEIVQVWIKLLLNFDYDFTIQGFPVLHFGFEGVSSRIVVEVDDFWEIVVNGLCHHKSIRKIPVDVPTCG